MTISANVWFPIGEKGSINDLAKRAINEPTEVLYEIYDKPKVCLNIILQLERYAGTDIALTFAKQYIDFINYQNIEIKKEK